MKIPKEAKVEEAKVSVLKCEGCGEEYMYDSYNRICPTCGGALQKGETIVSSRDINVPIR